MSEASTMLFLVVVLLMFLIIMAYVTKARIYNLLAIAPIMYITIKYIDSLEIVILMIGLFIHQLYLTFKN